RKRARSRHDRLLRFASWWENDAIPAGGRQRGGWDPRGSHLRCTSERCTDLRGVVRSGHDTANRDRRRVQRARVNEKRRRVSRDGNQGPAQDRRAVYAGRRAPRGGEFLWVYGDWCFDGGYGRRRLRIQYLYKA